MLPASARQTCLFIPLFATTRVLAQEPPQPSADQEIEALEKRLMELKQRKREELLRQIKALQEQLINHWMLKR